MKRNVVSIITIGCIIFTILCSLIYPIHKIIYSPGETKDKKGFAPSTNGIPNILLGSNGSPICTAIKDQQRTVMCGDEDGGTIIVWEDFRSGVGRDLYAQRIDGNGNILWAVNGTPIYVESNEKYSAQICSDGAGGAFITWYDNRNGNLNYEIYAQRVNSTGDIKWHADGIAICTELGSQWYPQICSDGGGGAIITWQDYRSGSIYDIYAQHIDLSGNVQWDANGTVICTELESQWYPQICSDGGGGAIITWQDYRSGSNRDIYAQHIDSNGITDWSNNGTAVCTESGNQWRPQICSDGSGGAIIVWYDTNIFVQRINSIGNILWTNNGTPICTEVGNQERPRICGDGKGGAFVTWGDERNDDGDIYAQYINSMGEVQWDYNGTAICTAIDYQLWPDLCIDGMGGIVITWTDVREGYFDAVYGQYVKMDGTILWEMNGSAICNINARASYNPMLFNNELGSVVIAWTDYRSEIHEDIFAQIIKTPLDPLSNRPLDLICSIGSSETIDWVLHDDSGGGNYRVWANNIHGDDYLWIDWTPWSNNSLLSVPINRSYTGIFEYTIEYYDDDFQFGINDTVKVIILEGVPSQLWDNNGTLICNASDTQENVQMCSDGDGGIIIVWEDNRNDEGDIYAQRINSTGAIQWDEYGVPISTAINIQQTPKLCSDGMGGAFIVWSDYRNSEWDIYGQRINSTGAIQWDLNGAPISTAINTQVSPYLCNDGQGGVIISWHDTRNGGFYPNDIYAQRINSSGHAQWTTNGIAISLALYSQSSAQICSDGNGGAIIVWNDHRSGNGWRIYGQRVNSTGDVQWSIDGVRICASSSHNRQIHMSSDGIGGAVVTWQNNGDIYSQRINSTGDLQWNILGVPVSIESNEQRTPRICSDGNGGAFITWEDRRNDDGDIYAQYINKTGSIQWELNGLAICTQPNSQENPQICYNDNIGIYLTWEDSRTTVADIYVQLISLDGLFKMENNGTAVCTEINEQILPQILCDDNSGAFVAWEDYRNNEWDIYGQYIIFDSPPISNHPIDIITDAYSLETIGWTLNDLIEGGKYRVIVNDVNDNNYVCVDWTSWNGYTILNVPINRTKPGTFNYIIDFYDSIEQYGISDEVEVTILDRIPFSNHPEDIAIEVNLIETIDWILIDEYGIGQYCIIKDGVPGTWSDWVNNTVINYNVDTSIEGSFNYTISYYDSESQFGIEDTVIVDVTAAETPTPEPEPEPEPEPPGIPGYNLYVVISMIGIVSIILFKKRYKLKNN